VRADSILLLMAENPVHTMIFFLTFYMWYCIFDRLIVYIGFFIRRDIGFIFSEQVTARNASGCIELVEIELGEIDRMLRRNMSVIRVSTVIAPMLGLLGTVWGMLITFNVISDSGTGNPALMAGGISEALTSTRLGLTTTVCGLLLIPVLERMRKKLIAKAAEVKELIIRTETCAEYQS